MIEDKIEAKFFVLIRAFWRDLGSTEFYWQLAALALILVISWWLAYRLRGSGIQSEWRNHGALRAFGAGGLRRLAFPAIALLLVLILRRALVALGWTHLSVLHLAVPLLVSWALVRTLVYALRAVFSRSAFVAKVERAAALIIWSGLVLQLTQLDEPVIEMLEQISFGVGKNSFDLWMILKASVTIILTLLVALWIGSQVERRLLGAQMDGNLRVVVARVSKALLSVVALLVALSLLGIDLTALSVFTGALGVGLGIGLQKIASNYVSGFIILLDRSIRLGNLIAVDDKTTGTVTEITTRYTVLRMLNGTEVIIPNEYLVSNILRNLSLTDTRIALTTSVQIAYGTQDLDGVMASMVDAARRHPRVLADPPPAVQLVDFADSGVKLDLIFWIADPQLGTGNVRSEVNLELWRLFRANGIEIPFPQRELRILDGSGAATAAR